MKDQAAQLDPFSEEAIYRFYLAILRVLQRELHLQRIHAEELSREFSQTLRAKKEGAWPLIASRLETTGIRCRWNQLLAHDRPSILASWISPYCCGTVLDLLCGDGNLGEQLALMGPKVVLTERMWSYNITRTHAIPFIEFTDLMLHTPEAFDTVLICTVLHHEIEPAELLSLASRLGKARLIIIENSLDKFGSEETQLLMDLFFARCLNSFSTPAIGQHRTISEWISMANSYGVVRVEGKRYSLPGIPLSHDMIVVDLVNRPESH